MSWGEGSSKRCATNHRYPPALATAKTLRSASTDAENKLWYYLRAGRLGGFKFRRQHPLPPYVADFYCEELRLVIELDGSQHSEENDLTRTNALERLGLLVLRFWDNQVLQEVEAVLEVILNTAQGRSGA
jgi:very-short-patch-repair endonuclease